MTKSYLDYSVVKYKKHDVFTIGTLAYNFSNKKYIGTQKYNKNISCFKIVDCDNFYKFVNIISGEKKIIKLIKSVDYYFVRSEYFNFKDNSKVYVRKFLDGCIEFSDRQIGIECIIKQDKIMVDRRIPFDHGRYYLFNSGGSYIMVPVGFNGFNIIAYSDSGNIVYIDDIVDNCVFDMEGERCVKLMYEGFGIGWFGILKNGVKSV